MLLHANLFFLLFTKQVINRFKFDIKNYFFGYSVWSKTKRKYISKSKAISLCVECKGGYLILRHNNKIQFLGCTNYPICKYTISLKQYKNIRFLRKICKCKHPIVLYNNKKQCVINNCENYIV